MKNPPIELAMLTSELYVGYNYPWEVMIHRLTDPYMYISEKGSGSRNIK